MGGRRRGKTSLETEMRRTESLSLVALILVAWLSPVSAQADASDEKAYLRDHDRLVQLYEQEKYEEGIAVLEQMRADYPSRLFANSYNLGLFHAHLGHYGEAMDAWEYGLDRGVWFLIDTSEAPFEALADNPRFQRLRERIKKQRKLAREQAKAQYKVVLPHDFDPSRRYPLFLALHGENCSAELLAKWWNSITLQEDFVVAYLQSSQVAFGKGRFNWKNLEQGRSDISQLYYEIVKRYPVAVNEVYLGGYSEGARMALDMALARIIPVKGVVAMAPSGQIPPAVTPSESRSAARRGLRVVIFASAEDQDFAQQELIAEILREAGVAQEFHVDEDNLKGVPENFDTHLEDAIAFIRGRKRTRSLSLAPRPTRCESGPVCQDAPARSRRPLRNA